MITGYPSVESAVDAMKEGAADFITKPLRLDELRLVISRITRIHASQYAGYTSGAIPQSAVAAIPPLLPGKVKELSILYGISEAFQPCPDTEGIFQGLVQAAADIVRAYSSSFTMIDPVSKKSTLKAYHGCNQNDLISLDLTFQGGLLDRLNREKKPISLKNIDEGVILPIISKDRLLGVLHVWNKHNHLPFTEEEILLLLTLCRKSSLSIENQFLHESLYQNLLETLKALVATLEARDPYTGAHSQRVSQYATAIAAALGYSREEQDVVRTAGFLHDIGKVGICDAILLKAEPLTPKEYEVIKTHPIIGERIVQYLGLFTKEKAIIRHHHEWWDGRGYPDGLSGHQIPPLARIMTVADAFDAITTNRPYRTGQSFKEGIEELERWAGIQFDAEAVAAFRGVIEAEYFDTAIRI